MMHRRALFLIVALAASCTHQAPTALPAGARPDLGREWVNGGEYRWPPGDGFAGPAVYILLTPGVLLDRFGAETGRFFSPKGATFRARALPMVCAELPYSVYRIARPLPVRIGAAAAWFGEFGGATQVMTDATAAQLVADGTLTRLTPETPLCPQ
jgi:hypothetical protein